MLRIFSDASPHRAGGWQLAGVFGWAMALLVIASCGGSKQPSDAPPAEATQVNGNNNGPQWVYQADPHKPVAVVFVHGIFGDTLDTWTNASGTRFFDLLHQSAFGSQLDIYAFGYTSKMFEGGSLSIDEAARSLHQYLQFHGLTDYDQIVFVAHSMGGLVAMQEITSHTDLAAKVPLMVLYATPQQGAQITAIAQHIVNNDAIRQMLLVDQNGFLRELNNEWTELRGTGNAPRVICAYEKRLTKGIMIVPWSSASRNCDEAPPAIEGSDHLSIVKPSGPNDLAVAVLINALETYVMPRLDASNWQLSNVTSLGDDWVYDLHDVNNFNRTTLTNRSALKLRYRIIRPDSTDLYISPESDTRSVAAGGSDEIRMLPLGNELRSEYTFQLGLAPATLRRIVVRIPDMQAAVDARASRTTETVQAIAQFLGSQADPVALNSLTVEQKNQALANAAFEFLSSKSGDLSEHAKWIMTADTLSRIGMSNTAIVALQSAEKERPEVAQSASVRNLAALLSAQSGKSNILNSTPVPVINLNELKVQGNDLIHASEAQRNQWKVLSERLEKLSAFRGEALMIKGDIQAASGEKQKASELYQQAVEIKATPWLGKKLAKIQAEDAG